MKLKFRLICYAVIALTIPLLIWIIYHEVPMDSIKWIAAALVLFGLYEIGLWIQKIRRKRTR